MRLGMGLGLGNLLSGQPLTGFPNDFSFNFDGSNDYLDTGTSLGNSLGTTTALTLSVWVKNDNSGQDAGVFKIGGTGNTNGNFTLSYSSNRYYFSVDTNDSSPIAVAGINNTITNSFQHFVCVYNGTSQLKIYLNGVDQSLDYDTGTEPSSIDFTGNNTLVGQYYNQEWDGLIDEVGIWDTALSASDVAKIGSKVVDLTKYSASNLKLWLRAGDKVLPESDASIARSDFYTDFDGTDDHIIGSSIGISGDATFSIAFWAYWSGSSWVADFPSVVGNSTTSTGEGLSTTFNAGRPALDFWVVRYRADNALDVQRWYHLAFTKTPGNISSTSKIYVNGVEVAGSLESSDQTPNIGNSNIQIGRLTTGSSLHWEGKISNVSIYQTVIDSQTISQMAKSRYTPMRDNRFSVVDFDGSDDFIDLGALSLDLNTTTISAWVKTNDTSQLNQCILGEDSAGVNDGDFFFGYDNEVSDKWQLVVGLSGNNVIVQSDSNATTDWTHLVATLDGSTMKLYVNGVLQSDTESFSGNIFKTSNHTLIGAVRTTSVHEFNGSISSVSIYSTAKSAEEIYAIYQQGITYDESSLSGLQGYWRMGDDTSKAYPTIADSSSNSNDGTITNGASDDIVQQMISGYDMGAFESSSEELGGEIVTNGSFDTDSDWSKGTGWSINATNGIASADGTSGFNYLSQSNIFNDANALYKMTITIDACSSFSSGAGIIKNGSVVAWSGGLGISSTGTHTVYFTNSTSSLSIFSSSQTTTISNISVKEVLQSEVSDTYPAIIDVNEPVLGVETITNGDFSSASSWTADSGVSINTTTGKAIFTNAPSVSLYQGIGSSLTGMYFISFDITAYTSGNLVVYGGGQDSSSDSHLTSFSSVGSHTEGIYLESSFNGNIIFGSDDNFTGSIDNVSVKPISGNVGNMTNQAPSDLVYSSVLPDQSFLTGVNSAYNFLDFDGTDAKVTLSSQQSLTGDFTISGWLKVSTAFRIFISDSTSDSIANYILMDNNLDLYLDFQGLSAITFTNSNLPSNQWFHFAITRNAKIFKCYVNSTLTDTEDKSSAGAYDQTWTYNQLGTYNDGQYWYDGNMSGLAIHNKELISTEISAIYNAGRHSNLLDSYSDNIKGYYAFGALDAITGLADTDSTIYDRSGNSVHGTTSGTATSDLASSPNAEPNGYAKGDTNRSTTIP